MKFTLWMEGYGATGDSGTAQCLGTYEGDTFADAVQAWVDEEPDRAQYFKREGLTYWCCRFFDNEADARKSFG